MWTTYVRDCTVCDGVEREPCGEEFVCSSKFENGIDQVNSSLQTLHLHLCDWLHEDKVLDYKSNAAQADASVGTQCPHQRAVGSTAACELVPDIVSGPLVDELAQARCKIEELLKHHWNAVEIAQQIEDGRLTVEDVEDKDHDCFTGQEEYCIQRIDHRSLAHIFNKNSVFR